MWLHRCSQKRKGKRRKQENNSLAPFSFLTPWLVSLFLFLPLLPNGLKLEEEGRAPPPHSSPPLRVPFFFFFPENRWRFILLQNGLGFTRDTERERERVRARAGGEGEEGREVSSALLFPFFSSVLSYECVMTSFLRNSQRGMEEEGWWERVRGRAVLKVTSCSSSPSGMMEWGETAASGQREKRRGRE